MRIYYVCPNCSKTFCLYGFSYAYLWHLYLFFLRTFENLRFLIIFPIITTLVFISDSLWFKQTKNLNKSHATIMPDNILISNFPKSSKMPIHIQISSIMIIFFRNYFLKIRKGDSPFSQFMILLYFKYFFQMKHYLDTLFLEHR